MNSTGDVPAYSKIAPQKKYPWEEIKITLRDHANHARFLTVCYRNGKPYKVVINAVDASWRSEGCGAAFRYFFEKDYFECHTTGKMPEKMKSEDKKYFEEEFTEAYNNIKYEYRGEKKDSILQLLDNILKKL